MKLKLKFILIALCPVFGVIFLTFFFLKAANQVIVPVIIASVIISLVMVAIILLISRGMLKQFDTVDRAISTLSKKDFSLDIENNMSSDSFSLINNINKMIDEINDFFVIVKTTTSRAISSGYMINDSANSTAAATSLIDSNLENIHREFNEISNAIRKSVIVISEMNTHIETLVDSNKTQTDAIEESSISVNKVAETLEHMNNMAVERTQNALEMDNLIEAGDNKITLTNQMLTDINSKLDEVKGVVTIINNVASKTNLLSMNAAIESAHAGEAGKGFAVVAGQIRSLAEATQINSVRISEVIQNIVNSLSQANITSNEASVAFKKISTQSARIVSSLQEITSEIGEIDNQMQSIKTKSEETSITADQIDSYCTELKSKQQLVSSVVDSMNDLFVQTMVSIREIKKGTKDIVQRMREVSSSSKNSYKGMTDLENVLEEFKTKQAVQDAVQQADSESIIANVVSEELQNMSLMEDFVEPEDKEEIEFDLDSVTEYEG